MEETQNVTLKVRKDIYEGYRKLCKYKGWIVSRQFELLMEETLKSNQKEGKNE